MNEPSAIARRQFDVFLWGARDFNSSLLIRRRERPFWDGRYIGVVVH